MKVEISALLLFFIGLIAFALLLSASSSRAVHDPSVTAIVSGDTNIFNAGLGGLSTADCDTTGFFGGACSGNFYVFDETANGTWDPDAAQIAMRQGPIDFCSVRTWTAVGTDNVAVVDIVIRDVTDLTGYQVRINYDETMVNFVGTRDIDGNSNGFLPFQDRRGIASQFVNTLNLIPQDQTAGHLNTNPVSNPGSGTVLLADTYVGTRSAAVSADVGPAGAPPNAPEGGLLVRTLWELEAPSDGNLLAFNIAETPPSGPSGTTVLVFDPANPASNMTQTLPENHLRDFFIASDGPGATAPPACATSSPSPPPPPATPTPAPTATPAPTGAPTATATPPTGATPTRTPTPGPGAGTATPTGAAGAGTPTATPRPGAATPTRAATPAGLPPTGGGLPGSAAALPLVGLAVSLAVIATVGGVYVWRAKRRDI